MKEFEFLDIISNQLSDNSYIGDDCAFLDDLGIFVTHDTLVENIHFTMYTTSAYMLGRKSVAVNLSDLAAALCEPEYITISLSLPSDTDNKFVSEFYRGVNDIVSEYRVKVVGGDITGAEKITVSVCAIGKKNIPCISSRKNAKKGDVILVTGQHGNSSAGLYALQNFLQADDYLINSHLNPKPRLYESKILSQNIDSNIAVIDSSDGLIDALYRISAASKHSIEIDINKVPVSTELIEFSKINNIDYKNFVMWGAEDYELVITVPEETYINLDKNLFTQIGKVQNKDFSPVVSVQDGKKSFKINREIFEKNAFNHFGNKI